MHKINFLGYVLACLTFVNSALADTKSMVVAELFTSQGCSSCPPADALLKNLAKKQHVLALAFHVDYWDYIGWKDTFAKPSFTKRQKSYAKQLGRKHIYTPQMIINGRYDVIGSRAMEVADILSDEIRRQKTIVITKIVNDKTIALSIAAAQNNISLPHSDVLAIRFRPYSEVSVNKGENKGKTLVYANVVTSVSKLGTWRGERSWKTTYSLSGSERVAIIVQKQNQGEIYGSVLLR